MNWLDLRVRFYRWFRFKVLGQEPACYPTDLAKVMSAILFPLEWLYQNQTRIKYSPETDTYVIRGASIRGRVFERIAKSNKEVIALKKDEFDKWEIEL